MQFEEVLQKHVGQFGRFQKFILLFIAIEEVFMAFHVLSPVFLVAESKHHCHLPELNFTNLSSEELLDLTIPRDSNGQFSSCQMFSWNLTEFSDMVNYTSSFNYSLENKRSTIDCKSWDYDDSLYKTTMVTEWDLVCNQAYQASSFAAAYMAGWIVGCSTFGMAADWFANGFVYYGFSLNTSNLGGNPYLNFLIAGAVELPAYLMLIPILKYCGRVIPYTTLMLLAGVSLVAVIAIPADLLWLTITVSMIGKFCISATFAEVNIYTAEVYPTEIRSTGVHSASVVCRFGSILGSYLPLLGTVHQSLPLVVFGILSTISGLFGLALPETKGTPMLQTLAQGEAFVKQRAGEKCCFIRKADSDKQTENQDMCINQQTEEHL